MRKLTLLLTCSAVLLGVFLVPRSAPAQVNGGPPPTCAEYSIRENVVVLNIAFPGLHTTMCSKGDGVARVYSYVDTFGNYLVTFYLWFAGAAGTLAVFMVMFAGFQWLTAAGNAGRIGQAKETITGAIVGLILLLGSYVLLSTISTGFVNLPLYVKPVEGQKLLSCYQASASKQCTDAGNSCGPLNNVACGLTDPLSTSSSCGCTVQCPSGEVWKPFHDFCASVYGPFHISWDLNADPGSGPVAVDFPVTFGQIYAATDAYFQKTENRKWDGHPTGITQFLYAQVTEQQNSPDFCSWLQYPVGTGGCPSASAILHQWIAFYKAQVQTDKTKFIVGQNQFVCCQSSSDPLTCTARDAVLGSKSGRCGNN